jgi:hypothetical protein
MRGDVDGRGAVRSFAMHAVRVTWAVAAVLGAAAALFVPVVLLPFLLAGTLVGRRASRAALAARDGRASAGALAPPLLVVVVALLLGPVRVLWHSRRGANWNFFGPYEAHGPNPAKATGWIDLLLRSPHETLVYLDPWFAGVFLPVLLFAVPAALLLALWLATRPRD